MKKISLLSKKIIHCHFNTCNDAGTASEINPFLVLNIRISHSALIRQRSCEWNLPFYPGGPFEIIYPVPSVLFKVFIKHVF